MWELIRENKRKSLIIFICMGLCLILLGYIIGLVLLGEDGGVWGVIFAVGLWLMLSLISYSAGDNILLYTSKAQRVTHSVHPQLFNIVEEMKIASGLPAMPEVYIIDEPYLNAFATGRDIKRSKIVVTAGLLNTLNRDELQGVIAHEMSHIINRDVAYMTFAAILLGSIVIISEIFIRSLWYSGGYSRRYRVRSSQEGGAQAVLMIIALVFAILSPILVRIFYFALSRKREYLADASAVRLTRYPQGLASALEKIAKKGSVIRQANKITAPMYIANPLKAKDRSRKVSLFSTHPPIEERIRILRSIAYGANYRNYLEAFQKIKGAKEPLLPPSALKDKENIPIRESAKEEKVTTTYKEEKRNLMDLMRIINNYVFLTCVCGLKMKIPPGFKKDKINCPRCHRELKIPQSELLVATAGGLGMAKDLTKEKRQPIVGVSEEGKYIKKTKGWESFRCLCGRIIHLSPMFKGESIRCDSCGKKIKIQYS